MKQVPFLFLITIGLFGCITNNLPHKDDSLSAKASSFSFSQNDSSDHIHSTKFFEDSLLNNLIELALHQNSDMAIAEQRIAIAQAQFRVRRGQMLPTVEADLQTSYQKFGTYTLEGLSNDDANKNQQPNSIPIPHPVVPNYFIGLRSQWEIDLWGKLRAQKKSGYFQILASQYGKRLIVTSLVSEVASRYYELIALDETILAIERNRALQDSVLSITLVQKEAGRTTELGVQQMQAQLLRTEAMAFRIQQKIVQIENELNFFLGRMPQAINRSDALKQDDILQKHVAISAQGILHNRPDILQAESNLQAAGADLKAAQAALLPSLTLSPYVGLNAFSSSFLFNPASIAWGVLGGLTTPLINRSMLRGNQNRARAEREIAHHQYQKTIFSAFSETQTILSNRAILTQTGKINLQEVATLHQAISTANELFKVGYASYLEVISAQKMAIEAELALIETRNGLRQAEIALYRAIGGGW
ncbi:MAG: TolC family protein [Bacteroidetes bacterium]|nr:TolC family protein [Bacteroidota bacterium]